MDKHIIRVMVEEKKGFSITHMTKKEHSLSRLINALVEYNQSLGNHIVAMEGMIQAIEQFDATIKREMSLRSHRHKIQLKEVMTSFVESKINPQYYKQIGYLQLTGASRHMPVDFAKIKPKIKVNSL